MKYSSIVPTNMSQTELRAMCSELQIAKNWNCKKHRVTLTSGQEYDVDVADINDYRQERIIDTGKTGV